MLGVRTRKLRRLGVPLLIMIRIPRRHATAVIAWLDNMIAPNCPGVVPDAERTPESRRNPYRVSATAQIAYWQSQHQEWQVTQLGSRHHIVVHCQDPEIETLIALKWSS